MENITENKTQTPAEALIPEESSTIVHLTEKAVQMVKETMVSEGFQDHSLRVAVVGGGCSGYQYGLNFDNEIAEDDVCYEFNGVKVVIDQYSAGYLQGTEIDYVVSLNGSGYKFNNPKAKRTCGCGSSFSV